MSANPPFLGFGLGLRTEHYNTILESKPKVDWFEALSENYMIAGGKPLDYLDKIRANYPVVMHGVSLSIGSTADIDYNYLRDLKKLANRIEPPVLVRMACLARRARIRTSGEGDSSAARRSSGSAAKPSLTSAALAASRNS